MSREITIIIVDDDAKSIKRLCDDLSTFPDVRVLETLQSPEKACKSIINKQPDILFLDVEMPEMTGIELLRRIQPEIHSDIKVVFYTAYDKYLIDALRVSAFDYLFKPYLPDELTAIIERYRYKSGKTEKIEQSLSNLMTQDNVIAVQTLTGLTMVNIEKILLFQFSKELRSWQLMHIDDYKLHRLRTNISASDLLTFNKTFLQISKDCIVNMQYLATIENKTLRCILCYPHHEIELIATQRFYKKIREAVMVF